MLVNDSEASIYSNSFESEPESAEENTTNFNYPKHLPTKEQELDQAWKRTLTNLFNYQTSGVLWYATAIASSGWVGHVYSLMMLLCSLVSAFMLSELLAKFPSVTTYGALCNAVLSSHWSTKALKRARSVMDSVVNLEMFLYLCTVVATLAQSLVHIAPVLRGWPAILLTSCVVLPTTLLKDLSAAAQLSLLGIIATAVNLVLLVYVCFAGDQGTSLYEPNPNLQIATDVQSSVASVGLLYIAHSIQSSLPSITFNIRQTSLKHGEGPDQIRPRIRSVAYCSLLPSFVINTLFSSAAYMVYGPEQDILPVNFRHPIVSIIACSWIVLAYYSKGPRYLFILSDSLGRKVTPTATRQPPEQKAVAASVELGDRSSSAHNLGASDPFSDVEALRDTSTDGCVNSPGTAILPDDSPTATPPSTHTSIPVVATTVMFKYAAPPVTVQERPHREVVIIRIVLLVVASVVAYVSPSLVGLLIVGGSMLAACTMFIIPAFLLAADRGWINSALFDIASGGIPAVTAGLVDPSSRHKSHIYGYKLFIFVVTPALVALSIMTTCSAVLIY